MGKRSARDEVLSLFKTENGDNIENRDGEGGDAPGLWGRAATDAIFAGFLSPKRGEADRMRYYTIEGTRRRAMNSQLPPPAMLGQDWHA